KCIGHSALVLQQRLLGACTRSLDLITAALGIDERLQHVEPQRPNLGRAEEELRELDAFPPKAPRERDRRKKRGFGGAHVGGGSDEALLRLPQIGAALEERRRQSR